MNKNIRMLISTTLGICLTSTGWSQAVRGTSEEVKQQIRSLTLRLRDPDSNPQAEQKYRSIRDRLTKQIQDATDDFVASFNPAQVKAQEIGAGLDTTLADHHNWGSSDVGPFFARLGDRADGQSVLTAYLIMRKDHDSSAIIRGYRSINGKFQMVASVDNDFDRHGLFTSQLPSPIPGETWIIAWGRNLTFNGTLVRLRAYAFDGKALRTVWSPEDKLDAEVRLTANGFTLEYSDPERYRSPTPPHTLRDEYVLFIGGPVRVSSSYKPE